MIIVLFYYKYVFNTKILINIIFFNLDAFLCVP